MKPQKSIQVPVEFFTQTYLLIWKLEESYELDAEAAILCSELSELIEKKFEAMNRRDVFTKYKIAEPGSHSREEFRREYLDLVFMHKDWMSADEVPDTPMCDEDIPF